jgi:malonyl CoA-acyl carrier protein transacylase/NADP-dependent 3-hydroxy acid dehydrogenase YdfG/acyl carrier protein
MGKELYETYPAYAKALDEACAEIDAHLDRPLKDLLFSEPDSPEAELLDLTTYAQPALFATELAIYRLLESQGLKPDLLTGHSVGEIVAAHVSGVFSLPDAAKLISARGALMGALPEGGAMLAIEAAEAEALAAIEGKGELLSLAAVNSPNATVVSGDAEAIEELDSHFQVEGRKTKRLAVSHAFHSPLIEPMLDQFSTVVSSLDLGEPKLPVISNLSGEVLTPEQATDPAYWVSHARQPVRFADAVETLKERGATTYLELGPDAVLTAMAAATLDVKAALIPTLREGREEPRAIALSLAAAHASGAKLDWATYFKGTGAKAVPLPTYPFQRKRYWLSASAGAGDPAAMGLSSADHPLLSATIENPSGGLTFTGRVSRQTHPWLADHVVFGVVLLPGTAFVELALRAGQGAGCELLEELTLQAPLSIPEAGAITLQVSLSPAKEDGKREVSIHSRAEATAEEEAGEWTLHAQGVLSDEEPDAGKSLEAWPPKDAEPIELNALYEHLAEAGLEYGPAFQGLTSAWRRGDQLFAEVSLIEEQEGEATRFGAHPALLDAAFHAASEVVLAQNEGQATLPSAWRGVSLSRPGEGVLRVKLDLGEQQIGLAAFDEANAPVITVGSAVVSVVSPEQLGGQKPRRKDLLSLQWVEVNPAPAGGAAAKLISLPELGPERESGTAGAAHTATKAALELIQATLAEEPAEGEEPTRLALLTEGAVAAGPGEASDPAAAAVWGLLRSAQSEHPGRFSLIDSDASDASRQAIARALAGGASEPQLALREGELLAPRVSDQPDPGADVGEAEPQAPAAIDPDRSVLISGATGTLGALIARHLVESHGARHLLLTSRSGPAAEGAAELAEELEGLGASVRIEACDVASRAQVEALVASIGPQHPLGAVVHAAGVIEDGLASTMDPEQLDRVLAPKVDGAWNLHELSKQADLTAFVMFSSLTGTIGGPGQGNYAAANVFMDALAEQRQVAGLAATSIAWGMWQSESAITGDLGEADKARARRLGATEISDERGLELFDVALERRPPFLIAAPVEKSALARLDAAEMLPPILRGLVPRRSARRKPPTVSLAERLARVPEAEREATVLELVREEAAAVLGHASAREVPPERPFSELGFDSLAAVEMRNRLGAVTGTQLPATIVFDYPNAAALAGFLLGAGGEAGVEGELGRLEQALAEIPADDPQRQALAGHLRALAADLESNGESEESESEIDRLEGASDEELLEFIDQQVGR